MRITENQGEALHMLSKFHFANVVDPMFYTTEAKRDADGRCLLGNQKKAASMLRAALSLKRRKLLNNDGSLNNDGHDALQQWYDRAA